MELVDLVPKGNSGLIQAAKQFDPERSYRFSG
jgi:DNA-directed RNA polymerase sigma subunit (sigma70/sigma32)